MNWDDFRYFLAVARAGQLARAGLHLGVDATTVARRIRKLERALSQTLFEQTREGQILTEAGERLLLKTEAIERSMADIDAAAVQHQAVSGLVRLSVSEGFGTWFIARHLGSFIDAYPEILVDLVASTGFLNPSKRETDVAILLARPRRGPLISKKLSDYALRLYASREFLKRTVNVPTDLRDLKSHPLIGYIPDLIYAPELRYLDEISPDLSLRVRSTSINAQHRLISAGTGIGVLPCFIGDADDQLVQLVPSFKIIRTFWLVTHEDTRRLQRIEAFVNWLTQVVGARRNILLGDS